MSHTLQTPVKPSHVADSLAKSRLGVPAVVGFVISAAAPLTVVAGGATAGYSTGTLAIPLAYLVVASVLGVFSIGYVAMSRRIPHAGAFYTYLTRGLGRPAGVAGAFVALLAYNLMQIGLVVGFGYVCAGFANTKLGTHLSWTSIALVGCVIVAFLGVAKIDLNGKILGILLLAEIAITAVYDAVMFAHPAGGIPSFTTLNPSLLLGAGAGAALAVAIAGFVGFESSTVFAEETKNPRKTVGRATFIALAITGMLYSLSALAMSIATGPDNIVASATSDGSQLIFNLVTPHVASTLVSIGNILFVTSLFAAMLSFHHTVARYTYSLGREKVLPGWLASTSRKTGAPYSASLLQSFLAITAVIVYSVNGWDPYLKGFFWLTVLGGLGVLILMAATSIAVIGYFARTYEGGHENVWRRLIAPAAAALLLAAILWATLDQLAFLLVVPEGSTLTWLLPSAYAAATVTGLLWALILRAANPHTYHRIGLGPNSSSITTGAST